MCEQQLTYRDYARFARLSLDDLAKQCEAEAFHASGPGGQGVNTADSAVRMRHVPTGIVAVSRVQRSQLQNRQACLKKIRQQLELRSRRPKIRKATKPSKAAKQRRLDAKHRRSDVKASRCRPGMDD
jgi:ribosome-associated protein